MTAVGRALARAKELPLALALGGAISLASRGAVAQEVRTRDVQLFMKGNGLYDTGWIAVSVTGIVAGTLLFTPPRVDRAPLDGLGRREHSPQLGRAADASVAVGLGVGVGLAFLTELGNGSRGRDLGRAPLIMMEGAVAASAFTQLLKNIFGICRPRDWDGTQRRCLPTNKSESSASPEERENEARRSFPSGHNAPLAGMAGAALGIYALPTGHRPEFLPIALTSTGFALTTVLLREQAGAHSWVDTLGAFAAGGLAGFAAAALHVRSGTTRPPPGEPVIQRPAMLGFGGAF